MAQNIYDDPGFFTRYAQLPRSVGGLEAAPEWPALRALLPDLLGQRVLDLGCGFGWFARWARAQGAASVHGIDVSERMLARAAAATSDDAVTYSREDLERLELSGEPYDLVFSALALHYLEHLAQLFTRVHGALRAGGRFVFSVEHPMFTAPKSPGFIAHAAGHATWPVDAYFDEGARVTNWLAEGVVKQHRSVSTYIQLLRRAGFTLLDLHEWGPSADDLREHPEWQNERERPAFMLVACSR